MKLKVAVVGLLLPVLFSTTNSPSHTVTIGASTIARRGRIRACKHALRL